MQLCSLCRVNPSEYYCVRGAVCENCASKTNQKYGWSWMRMSDEYVGAAGGLITSPDDVKALKTNEADIITSIDNDVASWQPAQISDNIRLSWQQFRDGFAKFYNTSTGYLSASDDLNRAQQYQLQIRSWQQKLSVYGQLSSPMLPDPSKPSGPPTLASSIQSASSNLQTIAIVGLCVGAGLLLYSVYKGHELAGKGLDFATAHPETIAKLGLL